MLGCDAWRGVSHRLRWYSQSHDPITSLQQNTSTASSRSRPRLQRDFHSTALMVGRSEIPHQFQESLPTFADFSFPHFPKVWRKGFAELHSPERCFLTRGLQGKLTAAPPMSRRDGWHHSWITNELPGHWRSFAQ